SCRRNPAPGAAVRSVRGVPQGSRAQARRLIPRQFIRATCHIVDAQPQYWRLSSRCHEALTLRNYSARIRASTQRAIRRGEDTREKTMRGFVRSLKAHPVLTVGSMMLGMLEFVALQRSQLAGRVQQEA